jgi:mono/diheme cytochrome c family protein
METARVRAIKAHATGIPVPADLLDPAKVAMGTEHFSMHCAVCHGAPGVPRGDIGRGLYPQAPDLAIAAALYGDSELFWIIKHGIKMTGMPAWSDHSDAEIWATVAFIKQLKAGMTPEQYGELIKVNLMHGMTHQPGMGGMGAKDAQTPDATQAPAAPAPAPEGGHGHQH